MGRPSKRPIIVDWIKSLIEEKRVNFDTYISNEELYDDYKVTKEWDYANVSFKGFTTILNKICYV